MYNVRLFGIVTMNPPIQQIYPNKNEKKVITAQIVQFMVVEVVRNF
jgi:hypothetical protein